MGSVSPRAGESSRRRTTAFHCSQLLLRKPSLVGFLLAAAYTVLWWSTFTVPQQTQAPTLFDAIDPDANCPFRHSSLYRKVYVYPSPGDDEWNGSILSQAGRQNNHTAWPWLSIDHQTRIAQTNHYHVGSQHAQFSTELLVRQLLTHADSCLRTHNADQATLFWVPYLPSVEFHAGVRGPPPSHQTSSYAVAISNAMDGDYEDWTRLFGLTDRYWKRRNGSDHILVFSEPLQGLGHPKGKRGSYHFIHTQRQLDPPIIISVEVSTTFVNMHPACAAKNILLPYPVTDGRYFNGNWSRQATALLLRDTETWIVATATTLPEDERPLSVFFRAGLHGVCTPLRVSMTQDAKCSATWQRQKQLTKDYRLGMRLATFCPCPGGDTASAKRMFDAILAGCIPVVLSHDFVWPLSTDIEPGNIASLRSTDFSIRLPARDYWERKYNASCVLSNVTDTSLVQRLEQVPSREIERLRKGLKVAAERYSYYPPLATLVENPLRDDVLPTGGAARALVVALEERAGGAKWPACQGELEQARRDGPKPEPDQFVC